MTTVSKKRSIRAIAAILSLLFAVLIVPVLFACGSKQEEETPPAAQKYTITVASCVGGSVSASAQSAEADAVITVAATPDTGYKLSTLKYNDTDITLEKSFTMPAENVTITAEFTKLSYGITLGEVQNGTASVDKTEAHYGDIITVTAAPAAGYELDKIQVNGADITGNTFTMPAQNTTVNVSFKARQYNITCAAVQNGILGASTSKAVAGATVTVAATPASGYKLKSIKYNGTDITETKSFKMPAENVTITAEFEALSYTVSINTPENGTASVDKTKAIVGETITVTATPSAGYELDFIKVDGEPISGNTFAMPAGNATVAVGFKLKEYTVTVTDAQNGTVSASAPKATAGTAITITATPSAGYELKSIVYNDGADHDITSAKTFDMPAANVTVTTVFEAIEYNVSINTPDHGTASVSKTKATVGETITVTATPSAGYELDFIKVDGEPISGNAFAMPADNVDVTVGFKLTEYTITVNNAQNGAVVADATKATMGTIVTITTTPNTGYRLKSLKYNDGEDHDISATKTFDMPTANVTVTAEFEQIPYDVVAAPATNGNVSLSAASAVPGTAITVTATPDLGYALKSLKYNDGADHDITATCTFDMPAGNVTVTAVFEKTYTVSVGTVTGGTVSADKSVAFAGDTISLTVEAEDGYAVAELKYNTTPIDISGTTYTFAMPAENVTVTARFHTAHNITVNSDGNGTLNVASKAVEGVTITVTPQPNAGYELDTLKYNDGADHNIDTNSAPYTFTMPDSAVTVTVTFKKLNLTVTAASCTNGNISVDKTTAQIGDEVTVTVSPAAGYELETLTYTPAGGSAQDVSTTTLKFTMPGANVTVNATFKKATYTVTAASCTNGSISAAPTSAQIGDEITVTVTPATGYELDTLTYTPAGGSAQNISTTTLKFDMPGANVTVNATFKKSDLTVSTASCAGGSVAVDKSTAQIGDTVTVTVTPDAGYELDGIKYNDGEDHAVSTATTPYTFIMPGVNVTVSATFKKINYAVTAGSCTNGSVAVDKTTAQIGDTITVTATPDEGYELDKVQVNGSDVTGTTFTMPAAAVTVTATFKLKYYTIVKTVKPHGNYTLSGDPALGSTVESGETRSTATMGTKVTVTVTPDAGYTIQELFYVIGGTITATYMTKESNNVYYFTMPAKWVRVEVRVEAIRYDVSAGACTNGSVTLSADVATVEDTITVTATPAAGYELDKVYVNGDEISGTSFDMPAENVTVTATFKKATYTVTVADGITGGTLTVSSATAQMGDTITVTATPTAGYGITQLKYTYTSGEDTISGYLYDGNSFEMPGANVTISCVFKQITHITSDAEFLAFMQSGALDGYYVLDNDISISGHHTFYVGAAPQRAATGYNDERAYTFDPAGTAREGSPFTGVFDGQGYVLKDYAQNGENIANDPNYYYKGLFGYIGEGGMVGNFTMRDVSIVGFKLTAAIAGANLGKIKNVVIEENCQVTALYQGQGTYAAAYNAGIIQNAVCYLDHSNTAWGNRDMNRAVYESATGAVAENCLLLPTGDRTADLGDGWFYHSLVGTVYGNDTYKKVISFPSTMYLNERSTLQIYQKVAEDPSFYNWGNDNHYLTRYVSYDAANYIYYITLKTDVGLVPGNTFSLGVNIGGRYIVIKGVTVAERMTADNMGSYYSYTLLGDIFDGDPATYVWFTKPANPGGNITIDLGKVTTIDRMRIMTGLPQGGDELLGHVEYAGADGVFTNFNVLTGSDTAFLISTPINARYIKLVVDSLKGYIAVREVFINTLDDWDGPIVTAHNFGSVNTGSVYNLLDGDPETYVWFTTPTNGGYIEIDLMETVNISTLRLLSGKPDGVNPAMGYIMYSENGTDFTRVDSTEFNKTVLDISFTLCGEKPVRYIRIYNTSTSGWVAMRELYINSLDPATTSIAVTHNFGSLHSNTIVQSMIDGDDTTYAWFVRTELSDSYVTVDLLTATDINTIAVLTGLDPTSGDTVNGKVQVSANGTTYTDVGNLTSNYTVLYLENVSARFVRIVNTGTAHYMAIREIHVNQLTSNVISLDASTFPGIYQGAVTNILDGRSDTMVWFDNVPGNGSYIQFELADDITISSLRVVNGKVNNGGDLIRGYVSYSADGSNYNKLFDIDIANAETVYTTLPGNEITDAKYLRIYNDGTVGWAAMCELYINNLTGCTTYAVTSVDFGSLREENGSNSKTTVRMFDGDSDTYTWYTTPDADGYLLIDLLSTVELQSVRILNGKPIDGGGFDALASCTVEYSLTGADSTFVSIGTISGDDTTLNLGTAAQARYIRLVNNGTTASAAIREIMVNPS